MADFRGDDVIVMRCYGGDQRCAPAKVDRVIDLGNEYPLLVVIGRVFSRRKSDRYYSGSGTDGSPLALLPPVLR